MNTAPLSIAAGGATFTYLEQGSGVPLVLLHGVGSGARSWTRQLASLSARCRVVAWDGPGYGGSTALPMETPDADDYAGALLNLVDALGVDRMHLVGHSLGTIQALRFAVGRAQAGDLVITCGKGHEQSMCFGETEVAWDDRVALRAALAELLGIPGPAMPRLPTSTGAGA